MHNLKPNTRYKIITLQLACEESIGEAGMADGINEMLNQGLIDYPHDCTYSDWSIDFGGPVREAGSDPEEGELFDPIQRPAP